MKQLKDLKTAYVKAYLDLYRKARLSLAQDKEKKDLLQDYRLKHLRRLTAINSINSVQLTELDRQLAKLKSGTALTEKDLESEPKSPDGFWPSMEDTSVSAAAHLNTLKATLDQVHKAWTKSLMADLADPVIQGHFDLLKPAQRKVLDEFIQAKELPDDISAEFLDALQNALSGLVKLPVRMSELKQVLFPDGSPATPAEFKERAGAYLDQLLKGRDASKVRLVVE